MTDNKNLMPPPAGATFWELFDYFWVRGLGNELHADGSAMPWTAALLEQAFDGTPDKRSIENWQSRANMPSPDNLRRLSWIISGGDDALRRAWHEALSEARLEEKRREKDAAKNADPAPVSAEGGGAIFGSLGKRKRNGLIAAALAAGLAGLAVLFLLQAGGAPSVENIRICDRFYFDTETKDCTQHVSVFVHGIDDVYLSFDFKNVPDGAPFERWWIRNSERMAGRTSFNDEAWPGYTFWRPGVLPVGDYVVRIVVEGQVFTQTFQVQKEGFISEP